MARQECDYYDVNTPYNAWENATSVPVNTDMSTTSQSVNNAVLGTATRVFVRIYIAGAPESGRVIELHDSLYDGFVIARSLNANAQQWASGSFSWSKSTHKITYSLYQSANYTPKFMEFRYI